MKVPNKKTTPAKGWPSPKGGLRGGKVQPAAKYRAPMKGAQNVSC